MSDNTVKTKDGLMKAEEPLMDHFTSKDYKDFYEPAQDSYLFIDSLLNDASSLKSMNPYICLEIGSGSGFVINYLAKLLGPNNGSRLFLATDINPKAALATVKTAQRNSHENLDVINTSFIQSLERLKGHFDVVLFNPPYVPTESEEIKLGGIAASWAGGIDGREVIDKLLPQIPHILSGKGFFYMVLVQENKPKNVISIMDTYGFNYKVNISNFLLINLNAKNNNILSSSVLY
ncbi:hypothetical protein DLAC_11581 [Tieghemostelium lacteum]|uniref:Uncharacterized protein n=1 Tax=Tieghemostelium lacteum TaxID=361077 RepID=A0A151ZJB0_TIELA|nr:hypothetical protein DLAC_11581 [Tieghemostelium lacteum]|eukprot:KYQ94046.1 hypothetical protein DLAC_11581 [Tieghemostelium lacteum]